MKTDEAKMEEGKVSLYEDEIYGEKEAPEPTKGVVVFSLGDEWYGLDIMHVEEVAPAPPITLLPNAPEHIMGIFNLRGNVISITDLKKVFDLQTDEEREAYLVKREARYEIRDTRYEIRDTRYEQRIVVIQSNGVATGLLVDGSADSHEIPLSKIEPPLATLAQEKGDLIEGQFELNGRLVALLNAEKVIEKTILKKGGDI